MAKIYRLEDRIPLKVDDLVIKIGILTNHQKMEVDEASKGGSASDFIKASMLAVKYGLKDIKGLVDPEGNEYELEFENDSLSDRCLDELFNVGQTEKLITICLNLINGMPDKFYDSTTGLPLEGVEFIEGEGVPKRKKRKTATGK